jgi:hypothetical protein
LQEARLVAASAKATIIIFVFIVLFFLFYKLSLVIQTLIHRKKLFKNGARFYLIVIYNKAIKTVCEKNLIFRRDFSLFEKTVSPLLQTSRVRKPGGLGGRFILIN